MTGETPEVRSDKRKRLATPKHENIVKLVITTQNSAFQGLKWSPMDNVIFRVFRPLNPPPRPPRPPQWSGRAKNGQNALLPVQC